MSELKRIRDLCTPQQERAGMIDLGRLRDLCSSPEEFEQVMQTLRRVAKREQQREQRRLRDRRRARSKREAPELAGLHELLARGGGKLQ